MAKHTPGPWHVRPNLGPNVVSEHGDDPATIGDDAGRFVAAVKAQGPATDANARLIAAAPTMLDALVRVGKWLEQHGTAEIQCVACDVFEAIRKATEE